MYYSYHEYVSYNDNDFFTIVCKPSKTGKFSTIVFRTPYVDDKVDVEENILVKEIENFSKQYLENGFVVVYQHTRGKGKSSGDCIPYIYEREDGLKLHDWIRMQSFYNGEIYLIGGSYLSSVHLLCFPFEDDIKGAILEVK